MSHKRQFNKEEVMALINQGYVPSRIARILRCGYTTILAYFEEHNIDHTSYAKAPFKSKRINMLVQWDLKVGDWIKVRTYDHSLDGTQYYKDSIGVITQVTPYFATYKVNGLNYNRSFSYNDVLCQEILFEKIDNPYKEEPLLPTVWGYCNF